MTALLDDLLFMRHPGLKYIHVFDGIHRRAEELELAGKKDIADLMRWRVETMMRTPEGPPAMLSVRLCRASVTSGGTKQRLFFEYW
jgi:hypothetical protein